MTVRIATEADMGALVDLCRVMHAECAFHGAFVEAKVRHGLARCLQRQSGVVGVIDAEGKIAGGIALIWDQHWFTDDWHWADLFCYVRPEARGAAWGDLTNFAKWFVDQVSPVGGVPMPLAIGIFQPPQRIEALCRLYRGKFVQVGGTFAYGNTTSGHRIEARAA